VQNNTSPRTHKEILKICTCKTRTEATKRSLSFEQRTRGLHQLAEEGESIDTYLKGVQGSPIDSVSGTGIRAR
jgi:hypothetical protein